MTHSESGQGRFRHLDEQIEELKQLLLEMSRRAEELVDLAVEALQARDAGKAEQVVAADADVDAMEIEIEHRAIALLALQQPMARDLRFIVGAIKVSNDLERVGDHAVNIAQATQRLIADASPGLLGPAPQLDDMARRARAMLGESLDAFITVDGSLGRRVCAADDEVDRLHDSVFRTLLTYMMERPANISSALQLMLVSRNLERVADLATNIGEDAVYLAEGKQIKHHFEDGSR